MHSRPTCVVLISAPHLFSLHSWGETRSLAELLGTCTKQPKLKNTVSGECLIWGPALCHSVTGE